MEIFKLKAVCLLIILFPVCCLVPTEIAGQQAKVDSLKNLLAQTETDTGRMKIMSSLTWDLFMLGLPEESKQVAEDIINLASQEKYRNEKKWIKRKAYGLGILGIIETSQGQYKQAYAHHMEAIELRKSIADTGDIGGSLLNLGIVCYYLGEYPQAIKFYLDALHIAEAEKDSDAIATIYNNIGGVHEYQQQYDEALKNYTYAMNIRSSMHHQRGMATAYNNIGNIHDYQKRYEESLINHFKALEINTRLEDKRGIANNNDNIANTYAHMEDYAAEMRYRDAALTIYEALGDQLGILGCIQSIGSSFLKQKKYNSAFNSFSDGLEKAKEIGARDRIMDAYHGLAVAAAGMNRHTEAYTYDTLYTVMKDSLLNEANHQAIADMKEKYESEKKDAEITLLNKNAELAEETHKRKALTRNIIISSGIILVLLIFARFRFLHSLQVERIRNRISQDLHDDIGSTLSSISISTTSAGLMRQDKFQDIKSTLEDIGINARKAMENMSDIVWAINPAHETFRDMIERLKIFGYKILDAQNIRLDVEIPETLLDVKLTIEQRKNVYLILREAIHNVAKYSSATHCRVLAKQLKKKIEIIVKDDGVGFEEIGISLGGNGLVNMKHRADELHADFKIESGHNAGTSLQLQFPYA